VLPRQRLVEELQILVQSHLGDLLVFISEAHAANEDSSSSMIWSFVHAIVLLA
jgi:hypothetical protein